MKRSQMTILSASSAGNTISTKCCLLAAANNNASVRLSISILLTSRMTFRICSAILLPPGSRVTTIS